MRLLLLFLALLLSSMAAPAQTLPVAPADTLARQPLVAVPSDSASALHRMFAAKRNLRTIIFVGTVLTGGLSLAASSIFSSNNQGSLSYAADQTQTIGVTAVVGVAELVYFNQYSREREQLAQQRLVQYKLSAGLKHHLKARYFKGPALSQDQARLIPAPAPPPILSPPTPLVVATLTAVDTAAALHRLFEQRRHNGHVGLKVGGGVLAVSGIVLAIGIQVNGYNGLGAAIVGLFGAVASVPILIRGVVVTVAHSKGREQRVLQAWEQHRLPKRWARRALVPEYTQPQK